MSDNEDRAAVWTAGAVAVALTGLAGAALWTAGKRAASPEVDKEDPMAKRQEPGWPLALADLESIHESVTPHRQGSGRPHHGVDLMAPAGASVLAAASGRVLRVIDGSKSGTEQGKAAGLFVDVRAPNGWIYRYLHLGQASVHADQRVGMGDVIGLVGQTGETSGVWHSRPHLHFEIRTSDWDRTRGEHGAYGTPIDPLSVLPLRLLPGRIRKLIA